MTGNIDPAQVRRGRRDLMQGGQAARRWLPRRGADGTQAALKALLPVDVFGQPADLEPIVATAREHGLKLIEDSCEALGAAYKGRPAGAWAITASSPSTPTSRSPPARAA